MYYVEAKIHHMAYEKPDGTFYHKTIVIADNEDQARQKYQSYWDQKTPESRVYYTVIELVINQEIN
jgi:hypothetical protein